MSVEIQESSRARRTSKFPVVFLLVCVAVLGLVNLLAIPETKRAQADLDKAENAAQASKKLIATRDQLANLFRSPRRAETKAALSLAIAAAKPTSAMVFKAYSVWSGSDSYYLYSPDDSVSLRIQLDAWNTKNFSHPTAGTGTERSELIEVPLKAGQLHLFSFGEYKQEIRIQLDGRELAIVPMPATNTGGESRSHSGTFGLVGAPGTITDRYFDFAKASESAGWKTFADVQIRRALPNKNAAKKGVKKTGGQSFKVGILASLSTDSKRYVAPNQFLAAKKDLKLEWDAKLKRYKILGLKDK